MQALVTVVVSLSSYGRDFLGGLYVASSSSQKNFLALQRGDAVVHQSSLLHGVQALDSEDRAAGKKMKRWSWIMWFRDSVNCQDHSYEWFQKCADEENPSCLFFRRGGNDIVLPSWHRAAELGHTGATIKLARAYLNWFPSQLPHNETMARNLFESAIDSSDDPDAHYGLAQLMITKKATKSVLRQAFGHLEAAARHRHPYAMFNLGIAHTYGYGTLSGEMDADIAGEWFESCGLPECLWAKSEHSRQSGRKKEALEFEQRAKALGFGAPWRQKAREHSGHYGAGIDINLDWPKRADGAVPPRL